MCVRETKVDGGFKEGDVFLPGKPHGKRSLVGYSPWGCKESDMTKRLTHTQNVDTVAFLPYLSFICSFRFYL